MGWVGHVALCGKGEKRYIQGFGEETRERDYSEERRVDGRIILKYIFKKWVAEA